jgi:hypothetical protein
MSDLVMVPSTSLITILAVMSYRYTLALTDDSSPIFPYTTYSIVFFPFFRLRLARAYDDGRRLLRRLFPPPPLPELWCPIRGRSSSNDFLIPPYFLYYCYYYPEPFFANSPIVLSGRVYPNIASDTKSGIPNSLVYNLSWILIYNLGSSNMD